MNSDTLAFSLRLVPKQNTVSTLSKGEGQRQQGLPCWNKHTNHGQAPERRVCVLTHLYVDVLVQPDAATALFFGHLLRAFVARSVPPPWRSSFVMALSVCIVYLGVMCVFLLAARSALAYQTQPVGGSSSMALSLLPIDRNARITVRGFMFLPGREGPFQAGRVSAR